MLIDSKLLSNCPTTFATTQNAMNLFISENQARAKMMFCTPPFKRLVSLHQNIDFSCLMNLGKGNRLRFVQLNVNSSAFSLSQTITLCMCPWNTPCKCAHFISQTSFHVVLPRTSDFPSLSPETFPHNRRLLVKQCCEKNRKEKTDWS